MQNRKTLWRRLPRYQKIANCQRSDQNSRHGRKSGMSVITTVTPPELLLNVLETNHSFHLISHIILWSNSLFPVSCKKNLREKISMYSRHFVLPYPAGSYMFKVNNRNTRTMSEICSKLPIDTRKTPMTSFWCLYCVLWTYLTPCSSVSIINFEQINTGRVRNILKVEIFIIIFWPKFFNILYWWMKGLNTINLPLKYLIQDYINPFHATGLFPPEKIKKPVAWNALV